MTWSNSPDSSSDSAHSLSSGVFNTAGVQVLGTCGSSFVTDVIRVERANLQSAVKILTPSASNDPDLVSRFLTNARYNQSLNEFTGMKITEIVDSGPRPYYVMEKVAQSSLLEVIRLHAPIDARWLATLLLPVARMLDTIHQRNILHANIKPSNILVEVENNQEKFLLVDFMEPSLAATSATLTGAGVYAAPEFRMGMPVSNRSDIYSLGAVMYEALSSNLPTGPSRRGDGGFQVWRPGDVARSLNQVNPEIAKPVSDVIMNAIAPQAIARPASASALVEDTLRLIEQPRSRVRVVEPQKEHTPVPMLLIGVGVFLATLLLLGGFLFVRNAVKGKSTPSTTQVTINSTVPDDGSLTSQEVELVQYLVPGNQECVPDRTPQGSRRWPIANAIMNCTTLDVTGLFYGRFNNETDLDDSYKAVANTMAQNVIDAGGQVVKTVPPADPCSQTPNESGQWGAKNGTQNGGKFTCVTSPSPKIVWTERNSLIIGEASLPSGNITDLINWWKFKAGPK